ncbi:MAG: 16S rRNA (guanine(527)-N(7))-methyltransferase RsmG [Alphaproteobacteria bacterium]
MPEAGQPTPAERDALARAGLVSRETLDALQIYADRLVQWQARINLVGPKTVPLLWTRHILDSAQLWPFLAEGSRPILDIGSGAGFPGIVLGIASAAQGGPEIHCVESDGRKAAFLTDIISRTGAKARVHHARVEALTPWSCGAVTARACAPVAQLLTYGAPFLGVGDSLILLKGRQADVELTQARESWTFTVESHDSVTDPTGRILVLSTIAPRSDGSAPD